jgi:hypothetical protein
MACELLHAVPAGLLQEFQTQQLINFCLKVGSAHQALREWACLLHVGLMTM